MCGTFGQRFIFDKEKGDSVDTRPLQEQFQLELEEKEDQIDEDDSTYDPLRRMLAMNYDLSRIGTTVNHTVVTQNSAYILTAEAPTTFVEATFGYQANMGKFEWFCFNAQREKLFKSPYYRDVFVKRKNRAVVWASHFVEQPTDKKLRQEKYLIRKRNRHLIPLAAIYEDVVDRETGEVTKAFSIITTGATPITRLARHERSPLRLPVHMAFDYLDRGLSDEAVKAILDAMDDDTDYEIFRVHARIAKRSKALPVDDPAYIAPMGEVLQVEE